MLKVKELNKRLDEIFNILGNDEMFGYMLDEGEFESHVNCNDNFDYDCILCHLNLPFRKITINDLLDSYEFIKEYENRFSEQLENYLNRW